jgi:hypothetical protein
LEVCYCDFIQLCGKFLWLTFDIITNYRGIHKQANVLRRYGVCVWIYMNLYFPCYPHRYFQHIDIFVISW